MKLGQEISVHNVGYLYLRCLRMLSRKRCCATAATRSTRMKMFTVSVKLIFEEEQDEVELTEKIHNEVYSAIDDGKLFNMFLYPWNDSSILKDYDIKVRGEY